MILAKNMEMILLFITGLITTPLVVLAGTNLMIELRRWKHRKKAREFLRTARPSNMERNNITKYLKR